MFQMLQLVDEWRKEYHHDKTKVIFQNKELLTNVYFTDHSLHSIKNSKGLERLPETITEPNEVWSYWKESEKQDIAIRNYIKFGEKNNYLVQTEKGQIIDAFIVINSDLNKYRKGLILIK